MRIFVQQDATNHFLKGLGMWSDQEEEALAFPSRTSALLFCIRYYLSGVHLIVKHDDGHYEQG